MKTRNLVTLLLFVIALLNLSCDEDGPVGSLENRPPELPMNPVPADSATGIDPSSLTLRWTCGDPDYDTLTFGLELFIPNGDWLCAWNICSNECDVVMRLRYNRKYYWYIRATDEHGDTTIGPEWEFQTSDVIVEFPDIFLELSVRQAIGKATGDIYASEVSSLYQFDAYCSSITNLSGMEYMTDLGYLYLEDNLITDLSPLPQTPWFCEINLSNNLISNINPLMNNMGIGQGDIITLTGNPLDSISVNVYIPELIARGVTVIY